MFARRSGLVVLCAAMAVAACGGCASQSASLELITVARRGLTMAKEAQAAAHAREVKQIQSQAAALDAAFDADVRLAAAGGLKDAAGKPIAMSPEWVISARRGYSAARDAVAREVRQAEAASATGLDNLQAADEALEMASQLILQQMALGVGVRQQLMDAQRTLIRPARPDGMTNAKTRMTNE